MAIDSFGSVGPGSQPAEADGGELQYMEMPKGMLTFARPILPEREDVAGLQAALAVLSAVADSLAAFSPGRPNAVHDLAGLDNASLALVDQVLGEGEVSVICGGDVQAQESVLAGVWRVRRTGPEGRLASDTIEVGAFPSAVMAQAFAGSREALAAPAVYPAGVFNAPPLIAEINEHIRRTGPGVEPHAINLSLLPHTEEDLVFLDRLLGQGSVAILSRGYGNCRVTTTATRDVWWVRFYNSTEALILNTIEVTALPQVASAAPEDIADSHGRLLEILEVYR
ncbi:MULTISPECIES: hydrogenase expression/formation protein [unclassified Mesorhizobium]|uniref:hydrogenase expression/formation protein n=1 Tax=unclassified Mesorhizobium TaxID=325217 RepID=UPI000F74FD73|nr:MULTISPECIES: hydrogenase expression/formation protein [unclassified Mesorhizobium]AZO25518.1 hydrogenase expression/formation protein [Mesorhizobium sp. M1E.F.Ca.ET.045.02.1.1]RUW34609.1 hydrogenase expression/formation protein [Mesorhizobium sp. M1E.F.Ca.ET.041.01.1.1]RWD90874.1 MAG: hydrogenase expression/formation protein [Mesorhizobium sp.]RWD92175.1 MAG: hydrogenase expression/formation protein [Mesorhizobium sp.]